MKNVCATLSVIAVAAAALPAAAADKAGLTCPVMKAPIHNTAKAPRMKVNNETVYVCCPGCIGEIKKEPAKFLARPVKDPVTGKAFKVTAKSPTHEYKNGFFVFSDGKSAAAFKAAPDKYVKGS